MKTTRNRKPILVTGSHRSGSTWTGRMLASAPRTAYIHEPFNVSIKMSVVGPVFNNWFQYIDKQNGESYEKAMRAVLRFRYPFFQNLAKVSSSKDVAQLLKGQGFSILSKVNQMTPIIKDPIAIFSADWLSDVFGMNTLVLIRHPAAFCSSLKLKNWTFDFRNFLEQPLLLKRYLGRFEGEMRECTDNNAGIIQQSILLWNCIHHVIGIYREEHPEWQFARHEDLSRDPIRSFRCIFEEFDLEFTDKARTAILDATGSHNPSESEGDSGFLRNSRKNIHNWKRRLSDEEIEVIRSGTRAIADNFYSDSDW